MRKLTSILHIISPLYIFCILQTLANGLPSPLNSREAFLEHLTQMTNIPRAYYRIEKHKNSPFWILLFQQNSETREVPVLMHLYDSTTWFSTQNSEERGIKRFICSSTYGCETKEDKQGTILSVKTYLQFDIEGRNSSVRAAPRRHTENFRALLTDQWSKNSTSLRGKTFNNTALPVVGGVGFGLQDYEGETFLQSFKSLEHKIAGLYLSLDDLHVSSELLLGDYNPAYIDKSVPGVVLDVHIPTILAVKFSSVTNEKNEMQVDKGTSAIFDINTPYIGVPSSIIEGFLKIYLNNTKCAYDANNINSSIACECDENTVFNSLIFKHKESSLTIPSQAFVERIDKRCIVHLRNNKVLMMDDTYGSYWIFGTPILTYFYTKIDYSDVRHPQITLYKANQVIKSASRWIMITIGIIIVAASAAIAFFLISRREKKNFPVEEPVPLVESLEEPLIQNDEILVNEPEKIIVNEIEVVPQGEVKILREEIVVDDNPQFETEVQKEKEEDIVIVNEAPKSPMEIIDTPTSPEIVEAKEEDNHQETNN